MERSLQDLLPRTRGSTAKGGRYSAMLFPKLKREEYSGDLLSPGQQTGYQKTESDTIERSACTRPCTKVPRRNS